jgi:hypothetical protein
MSQLLRVVGGKRPRGVAGEPHKSLASAWVAFRRTSGFSNLTWMKTKKQQQQQQPQHQQQLEVAQKPKPKNAPNRDQGVSVHSFKEIVPQTVPGSTSRVTYTYSLNPGDSTIFPRLALLSQAWTMYIFRSLRAVWYPLGSAFAGANQTGQMVWNFQNNWYSAPSNSLSMADAKKPSKLGNAWEPFSTKCSPDILNRRRYLRSSVASGGLDMRLTDILAEFVVDGTPSTASIGRIELEGEVEFSTDYVANPTYPPRTNKGYAYQFLTQNVASAVVTALDITGGTELSNTYNTGVVAGVAPSPTTTFALYGGNYFIRFQAYVTGTTITQGYIDIVPGAGIAQQIGSSIANLGGSTFSASAMTWHDTLFVTVPEDATNPATLQFEVKITGTGTLTVVGSAMYIIALG